MIDLYSVRKSISMIVNIINMSSDIKIEYMFSLFSLYKSCFVFIITERVVGPSNDSG